MSAVTIKQVRSANWDQSEPESDAVRRLGSGRIGRSVERKDSPQLQGQLRVVSHLVEVDGG